MGQNALMADITKCFFQDLIPENQKDLFRILWFRDDDINKGVIEPYKFIRHVWGIISYTYIACIVICKAAKENATDASSLMKNIIRNSLY